MRDNYFTHFSVPKLTMALKLIFIAIAIFTIIFHRFIFSLPQLIYWKYIDAKRNDKECFNKYGCWFFVGKQGAGKSISIVETLERLRKQYPKLKIYTNMGYKYETAPLLSLNDLLNRDLYNGKFGTVFVIDEIQNEFAASTSRDFPESVLSLVTQQRKNHILILTSSQVFSRVSKPLREQCYRAIECRTLFGRYTMCRHYDGIDYADSFDKSFDYKRDHRPKIEYHSFVQTDELRGLFDSYRIIERLSRVGFSPKMQSNNNYVIVNNGGGRTAR